MNVAKALGIKGPEAAARYCDSALEAKVEMHGKIAVSLYGRNNSPCAAIYRGTALKAVKRYRFPSEEARANFVAAEIAADKERSDHAAARKDVQRVKAAAFVMPFTVGDVLSGSWGYDQTNQEFYEVVGIVGKRMIEIRALRQIEVEGSQGFMCEHVMPARGADRFFDPASEHAYSREHAKVLRRLVSLDGYVSMKSYYSLRKWDGCSKYQSHYA